MCLQMGTFPTPRSHSVLMIGRGTEECSVWRGLEYLRPTTPPTKDQEDAPLEVVPAKWRRHVSDGRGVSERRAYIFCVLDQLRTALRRRDVFVTPSWRYADPRSGLLAGTEWYATRPMICRTLGLTPNPEPALAAQTEELDHACRIIQRCASSESMMRNELILTDLDRLPETASLLALKAAIAERLPRVDLPEIILEIAASTLFAGAFTHISERTARAADLDLSLCAVLLARRAIPALSPSFATTCRHCAVIGSLGSIRIICQSA
jgi:hypothetical protein